MYDNTKYLRTKWAAVVKSNAHYTCIECGSTELIQAHDPTRRHIDPKDGQCLCAEHHSRKHPDIPKALFFAYNRQPYWENKSASTIAREHGLSPRTIWRRAKLLGISKGILSDEDEKRIFIKENNKRLFDKKVNYQIKSIIPPKPSKCYECGCVTLRYRLRSNSFLCIRCGEVIYM